MLNAPESNTKFTDEQSRQLLMFGTQLQNLQAEITIAQRNISSLKDEVVKAIKEKKTLESEISVLKDEKLDLSSQKEILIDTVKESNSKITELHASHVEITKIRQSKKEELDSRELKITEVEVMQSEKQKDLFARNATLLEDRLTIEKAKEAFNEAIRSVTW